jgi:hypothetical protein
LLQEGVGNVLRQAGLELMHLVMDEEVKSLAGERHQQHQGRRVQPWGKEDGYCVVDGRKVPIRKTRLRTPDKREQRLGSYELFQHGGPVQAGVWDKMMRGLSTRNYGAVVKDFQNAYGIEKPAWRLPVGPASESDQTRTFEQYALRGPRHTQEQHQQLRTAELQIG